MRNSGERASVVFLITECAFFMSGAHDRARSQVSGSLRQFSCRPEVDGSLQNLSTEGLGLLAWAAAQKPSKSHPSCRNRIGPMEVENALSEHPEVAESAVGSNPDPI